MNALLVKKPWIDKILNHSKTWEIRGSRTHKRGTIALVESGTGTIVGLASLVNVEGPLTRVDFIDNASKAGLKKKGITGLPYPKTFAWVLKKAYRLRKPVPYKHRAGAVIWVKLDNETEQAVLASAHSIRRKSA